MRWLVFVVSLSSAIALGCGGSPPSSRPEQAKETGVKSGETFESRAIGKPTDDLPPKSGGQDYDAYVAQLKADIPVEIKYFQTSNKKAIDYEKNERYPNLFKWVTLEIPRVYLTDKTTGKGQWYTQATLTLNSPSPPKVNSKGMLASVPEPFAWKKIDLR